jgi:hypothetical protein
MLCAAEFKLAQVVTSEKRFVKLLSPNPCECGLPEVHFFLVIQHVSSLGQ